MTFPRSLTTTPFERSSTGRLEAYSCKPAPGGLLPSSVQHHELALVFVTHTLYATVWAERSSDAKPRVQQTALGHSLIDFIQRSARSRNQAKDVRPILLS